MRTFLCFALILMIMPGTGHTQNMKGKMAEKPSKKELKKLPVVNRKDPVCGMPLRMGVGDTILYKGSIIGFCSPECKQKFAKSPAAYKVTKK